MIARSDARGGELRRTGPIGLSDDGRGRPRLRLKLRTKLAVAMLFAALVPAVVVALLATGGILSSLETGLREDADRQLMVGLNLILRSIERLGDETVNGGWAPHLHLQLNPSTGYPQDESWFQAFAGTAFTWLDSTQANAAPGAIFAVVGSAPAPARSLDSASAPGQVVYFTATGA